MNSDAFFLNRRCATKTAMRFPAALALCLLVVAPAGAAETAWQEVAPGVRARLISTDVVKSGKTVIGLELDMPQNTKTYWRIPGETGIATELDFTGSAGIAGGTILWPYPTVDHAGGYLDYVYFGPTVLPIELAVDATAPLVNVAATLGVCSDICIPAMVSFSLPLDFAKPDAGQGVRLSQAMAGVPIDWEQTGDAIARIAVAASDPGLTITLSDPAVDPVSFIADTGDPSILFGTPQKSPDGHSVFLPLLGDGDAAALGGQPIRITFMTAMGPYEIQRQVEAASTESAD
jgi:DsbC/DsbD-like thiol-disulfide interchange protein